MKKVLSVLLAAAMVMGMSVSAAAVDYSAPANGTGADVCADNITWKNAVLVDADGYQKEWIVPGSEEEGVKVDFGTMVEGDAIYFEIVDENDKMIDQKVPANWTLKIKNSEYIEDAELVRVSENVAKKAAGLHVGAVYAKVVLSNDFDAKAEEEAGNLLEFFMYIWDGKHASEYAKVHLVFDKYTTYTVGKGATDLAKNYWNYKDVIEAESKAYYKLEKGLNSAMVVFSIDESVYVTAKMWKGEKYMITSAVNAKWSKELSKQYDTDIELLTIESNMDVREVLFESVKDNKQVVEFVDGELVAVDSEFVTKYEVIDGVVLAKGYIADAEENGTYALISADIELIEVEEEATEEENKENPSTGANDFVGAAVALAVVSVAAAGALALKK